MKKPYELVTGIVLLSAVALVAMGARPPQGPPGRPQPPSFVTLDNNSDGKITREEWHGPPQSFDRVDSNGDGFISHEEFNAAPRRGPFGPPFADQLLKSLDTDSDGKISQSEFGQITQRFDTLDRNKDGFLTQDELGGIFHALGNTDATSLRRPGPPGDAGHPGPPSFANLDSNGDKTVSRSEWKGPADLFDRVDANHDGAIDQTEFAALQNRQPPGPPGGGLGARLLKFLDSDSDQKVSRSEFAALLQLFNSLDTDHDGLLAKEELGRLFEAVNEASR